MNINIIIISIFVILLIFLIFLIWYGWQTKRKLKLTSKREIGLSAGNEMTAEHNETELDPLFAPKKTVILQKQQQMDKVPEAVKSVSPERIQSQVNFNEVNSIKKFKPIPQLITLIVNTKPERKFLGYEVLQALLGCQLRFGKMNIFHYYETRADKEKILFSVASATEPGMFDINKMGAFVGKGLTLFMRLTEDYHDEIALEIMLDTAYQLTEALDGVLLDENRQILTENKINEYRQRVAKFLEK
jgi:cell division protein ZipA